MKLLLFLISLLFLSGCGNDEISNTSSYHCDTIINKSYYEICYNYTFKGAKFVSYTLHKENIDKNNIEKRPDFYEEKTLPKEYRAKVSDYIGSGYDKGHLASDASFDYSQEALQSVYSLANIIPQNPQINRYFWIQTEYLEREKTREYGTVDVIIGVDYDANPMRIGADNIAVPRGFYKMIENKQNGYKSCFYYENIPIYDEDDTIENHKVECSTLLLDYSM
ncbi:DNA/RNA non-specific endonuclease [hydrothermal vent metagenome]|uniref:DNA/RNA non-specific endonuclease n=1 Tax=hydrothermal vent metagenome TaxID=652676 RepID=A0A1W1D4U6_9ZZZZ